jgi:hypothetical protein
MNTRKTLVTYAQAPKLTQPGDGPLNNPTCLAQPAAVFSATLGQLGSDAPRMQIHAMRLRVVSPITLHAQRSLPWSAAFACQRRDRFDQRQQLSDIMAIGFGEKHAQRNTLRLNEDVVLATRLTAIGWVRSSFFPPCTARTEELSTTTRDKSIFSAPRSSDNSTRCRFFHTPAFSQARSRRQHVIPDPQPISLGNISQGMPDIKTNKMPVRILRSSRGLRPGCFRRRRLGRGSKALLPPTVCYQPARAPSCIAKTMRCEQLWQRHLHFVRCSK